jgi:hypothetical protein
VNPGHRSPLARPPRPRRDRRRDAATRCSDRLARSASTGVVRSRAREVVVALRGTIRGAGIDAHGVVARGQEVGNETTQWPATESRTAPPSGPQPRSRTSTRRGRQRPANEPPCRRQPAVLCAVTDGPVAQAEPPRTGHAEASLNGGELGSMVALPPLERAWRLERCEVRRHGAVAVRSCAGGHDERIHDVELVDVDEPGRRHSHCWPARDRTACGPALRARPGTSYRGPVAGRSSCRRCGRPAGATA